MRGLRREMRLQLYTRATSTIRTQAQRITSEASSTYITRCIWPQTDFARPDTDQCFPTSRFDSSKDRGDFQTRIGVGKVIKGALDLYKPEDLAIG